MSKYEWEPAEKHNPWGKKRVRGTHCSKGHEFTEENTFIRAYDNARVCRECRKQYAREKYQRNKVKNNGVARPKKEKFQPFEIPEHLNISDGAKDAWSNLQRGLSNTITNCAGDSETYSGEDTINYGLDKAEELCYNCPLISECYKFAVAENVNWGVWGGINFSKEYDEPE